MDYATTIFLRDRKVQTVKVGRPTTTSNLTNAMAYASSLAVLRKAGE